MVWGTSRRGLDEGVGTHTRTQQARLHTIHRITTTAAQATRMDHSTVSTVHTIKDVQRCQHKFKAKGVDTRSHSAVITRAAAGCGLGLDEGYELRALQPIPPGSPTLRFWDVRLQSGKWVALQQRVAVANVPNLARLSCICS